MATDAIPAGDPTTVDELLRGAGAAPVDVTVPIEGDHQALIACQVACPVHTDARGYVRAIAEGRFEEAYLIARGPNPFASICGRICGAPCEAACRRGKIPRVDSDGNFIANDRPIAIRALKRFVCDQYGPEARSVDEVLESIRDYVPEVCRDAEEMASMLRGGVDLAIAPANGEPIAIIGAGPAGLAAAHDLALLGFRPVVFELEPVAAGMLAVGVPSYRLPRELIRREVAVIEALGVEIVCNTAIGRDVSFRTLRKEFAAVLIAVGAKQSRGLGLPGEQGPGVLGGVDLLRSVALGEAPDVGTNVIAIGGGNVAYDVARTVVRQAAWDAARTAARLSSTRRVTLVSLESLEEMPADTVEILEGDEEGIERMNGWGPVEIRRGADGLPTGVLFRRCLRVYDEQRRFAPVFDEADTRLVPGDTVLLAVGQAPNLSFLKEGGDEVEEFRPGWPKVDRETLMTTAPGVFVAGDLAHGTRLLIDAVASGKQAARSIYRWVTGRKLEREVVVWHEVLAQYRREQGYEKIRRHPVPILPPSARVADADAVVELGYDRVLAMREASRCLDCGVAPVFDGTRCVLCGGCAEVCPTDCLTLVPLDGLARTPEVDAAIAAALGSDAEPLLHSAILKDEDRCIRCALCAMRCPTEAITMERICFQTDWRSG